MDVSQRSRRVHDLIRRNQTVDKPESLRLVRRNAPPREEEIARRTIADDARQAQHAARAGEDADLHLGETEDGVVAATRRSQAMASSDPPASAYPRIAAMVGIGRAASASTAASIARCGRRAPPRRGPALFEIGAGTECPLTGAGDDDRPDRPLPCR